MYGDFLVPENTNVNNAITTGTGAKWELFYSYKFEEEHAEGFEFPHEIYNDDIPLNLNGIMIVSSSTSSKASSQLLKINGETMLSQSSGFGNNVIKVKLENGVIDGIWKAHGAKTALANCHSTNSMQATFADSITSFEFSTAMTVNSTIEFYVLRGV